MNKTVKSNYGIVVIGRNEGERLRRCLESVTDQVGPRVYVDSGSVDGSAALAGGLSWDVVELDASEAFSAARARNAGLERLLQDLPDLEFVQFLDGDCELDCRWLERASSELERRPDAAITVGNVREHYPTRSPYNRLCDIEWRGSPGEIEHCGGIAFARVSALREVGGFDASIIAAEDTELCTRLRLANWKILRIDAEMALHDAAMTTSAQWWRRAVRAGHAFAQGAALHGRSPARLFVRERRGVWFWGLLVPGHAVGLAWPTGGASLLLFAGYVILAVRVYGASRSGGLPRRDAALYALHCVAAKFPQVIGQLKYNLARARGRQSTIIEHKGPTDVCKTAHTGEHDCETARS